MKMLQVLTGVLVGAVLIGSVATVFASDARKGDNEGKRGRRQGRMMEQDGERRPDGERGLNGMRGPGMMTPENILERLQKDLNLTDEQAAKVKPIVASSMEKARDARKNMAQNFLDTHKEVLNLVLSGEMTEQKARELFQQGKTNREQMREQIREEMFVERAKMLIEIKNILTPEQVELLKQKSAEFFTHATELLDKGPEEGPEGGLIGGLLGRDLF